MGGIKKGTESPKEYSSSSSTGSITPAPQGEKIEKLNFTGAGRFRFGSKAVGRFGLCQTYL